MPQSEEDNTVYDTLSLERRLKLASEAMPPLDFLKSVYADPSTGMPMDMKIAAARAALPYEHRKLPTSLQISDNRNAPLFNVNDLKKLSNDELRAFVALADKLGIDFGGRQNRVISGDVIDIGDEKGDKLLESIIKPTITRVRAGHLAAKSVKIVEKAAKKSVIAPKPAKKKVKAH